MELQSNLSILSSLKELSTSSTLQFLLDSSSILNQDIQHINQSFSISNYSFHTNNTTHPQLQSKNCPIKQTLKHIIQTLEAQIPKIQNILNEKNTQIIQYQREVQDLKNQLQFQKQKKQSQQQIYSWDTSYMVKKLDKIEKKSVHIGKLSKNLLKQKRTQTLKNRHVINQLKLKQIDYERRINKLTVELQEAQQTIMKQQKVIQQKQSIIQKIQSNYNSFKKTYSDFACQLNEKIPFQMRYQKIMRDLLMLNQMKLNPQLKNNKKQLSKIVETNSLKYLEKLTQKQLTKNVYKDSQNSLQLKERLQKFKKFTKFMNYMMKQSLVLNLAVGAFTHQNGQIELGYRMHAIPYVQTEMQEFNQIDWSDMIVIVDDKMNEQKWRFLVDNVDKFKKLRKLQISVSQMNDLKEQDLIKISHINKIHIKCGQNKEANKKLNEFMKKNEINLTNKIIIQ